MIGTIPSARVGLGRVADRAPMGDEAPGESARPHVTNGATAWLSDLGYRPIARPPALHGLDSGGLRRPTTDAADFCANTSPRESNRHCMRARTHPRPRDTAVPSAVARMSPAVEGRAPPETIVPGLRPSRHPRSLRRLGHVHGRTRPDCRQEAMLGPARSPTVVRRRIAHGQPHSRRPGPSPWSMGEDRVGRLHRLGAR